MIMNALNSLNDRNLLARLAVTDRNTSLGVYAPQEAIVP